MIFVKFMGKVLERGMERVKLDILTLLTTSQNCF